MSARKTEQLQKKSKDVFTGIDCLDGMFPVQAKANCKPYHAPPKLVAYTLQKPFNEELVWLQEQDIITPLGINETAEL